MFISALSLFLIIGSSGGNDEHAVVLRQRRCYRWLVSMWFQRFWHRRTAHLRPTSSAHVSKTWILPLTWIVVNTINCFTGRNRSAASADLCARSVLLQHHCGRCVCSPARFGCSNRSAELPFIDFLAWNLWHNVFSDITAEESTRVSQTLADKWLYSVDRGVCDSAEHVFSWIAVDRTRRIMLAVNYSNEASVLKTSFSKWCACTSLSFCCQA